MPLTPGSSKEAISHNIKEEMKSHPQKQAVAIAMREAGVPKPAKDAVAHDPKSGQFTSGSGAAAAKNIGKGLAQAQSKTESSSKKFPVGSQVRANVSGSEPAEVLGHTGNIVHTTKGDLHASKAVAHGKARDEQPSTVTQASSGMPLYKGRNLDNGGSCDVSVGSSVGCDWPGRVL